MFRCRPCKRGFQRRCDLSRHLKRFCKSRVGSASKNTSEFRQHFTAENNANSIAGSSNIRNDDQQEEENTRADLSNVMEDATSSDSEPDLPNLDAADPPVLYENQVWLCLLIYVMFFVLFFKQDEPDFPIITCQKTLMPAVTLDELDRANLAIELNVSDAKIEAVVAYADRRAG